VSLKSPWCDDEGVEDGRADARELVAAGDPPEVLVELSTRLKATAAKHSLKPLKFCGQWLGISSTLDACLTFRSCFGENPCVMCEMMSCGDGDAVPFVPSAHHMGVEPEYDDRISLTGVGLPIPY
jgi:hypothetical protein